MKRIFVTGLTLFICNIQLSARENCEQISQSEQLLNCTASNHPDLQRLAAKREVKLSIRTSAGQLINPEFDNKLLVNPTDGGVSTEINLKHTFELGGKRSSRVKFAEHGLSLFDKRMIIEKQDIIRKTVLTMYRYRQLLHEIETLKEAINSFNQVLSRYNNRVRLNPEQVVNRTIFQIARQEHNLRLRKLENERMQTISELKTNSGSDKMIMESMLLDVFTLWPVITKVEMSHLHSPLIEVSKEDYRLAESKLEMIQAEAWPDFSIGPSLEYSSNGGSNVGINFAFTAPLYHQNQGEKETAQAQIKAGKTNEKTLRFRLHNLRNSLVDVYNNITSRLDKKQTIEIYKDKHKQSHYQSNRGLVSASAVIELHRQEYELITSFHNIEMTALAALWKIYSIDGVILKMVPK